MDDLVLTKNTKEVPPRFELGSLDSKSRVLTITPWDRRLREKLHRQIQNKAHAMATKNYPVVFQFHTSSSLIVDGVSFVTREIIFILFVFTCWLTAMVTNDICLCLHRKKGDIRSKTQVEKHLSSKNLKLKNFLPKTQNSGIFFINSRGFLTKYSAHWIQQPWI